MRRPRVLAAQKPTKRTVFLALPMPSLRWCKIRPASHIPEVLRFGDRAAHVEVGKREGILADKKRGIDLRVEALGMRAEELGGADSHRAVHVHLSFAQHSFLKRVIKQEEKLLGTFHSEGRDINFPSALQGFSHFAEETLIVPAGTGSRSNSLLPRPTSPENSRRLCLPSSWSSMSSTTWAEPKMCPAS